MNSTRKNEGWKKAFEGQKVLPAEEVVKYLDIAETNDDLYDAAELASRVDNGYLMGSTEAQNEVRSRIKQVKKEIIESNPMGKTRVMENGLFWSVCCNELKEAVLNGEIDILFGFSDDTITRLRMNPVMAVRSPRIMDKMLNTVDGEYPEDHFLATCECPFCHSMMYDRIVENDGINPYDFRDELK